VFNSCCQCDRQIPGPFLAAGFRKWPAAPRWITKRVANANRRMCSRTTNPSSLSRRQERRAGFRSLRHLVRDLPVQAVGHPACAHEIRQRARSGQPSRSRRKSKQRWKNSLKDTLPAIPRFSEGSRCWSVRDCGWKPCLSAMKTVQRPRKFLNGIQAPARKFCAASGPSFVQEWPSATDAHCE
jgi:hypothetical protein